MRCAFGALPFLRMCAFLCVRYVWVWLERPGRRRRMVEEGKEDDKFCVCGWLDRISSPLCAGWWEFICDD